jgi:hypothetical protein
VPDLQIFIEPKAPPVLDGALTFETGATMAQVVDPALWAYEHHGAGFGQANPGALTCLYEDLALGRATPAAFVARGVGDIDTVVAMALFLYRDLLTLPATSSLVMQADLVHRRGLAMTAHVEPDVGRLFRLLRGYFPSGLAQSAQGERISTAVGWVRDYLTAGRLPALGAPFPQPLVLDRGPGGFVVAETRGSLPEAWIELYRQGYHRGVLFGARGQGTLLPALVARKSAFVPLDLERACLRLNEAEAIAGGDEAWRVDGDWLWAPSEGSLLLAVSIVSHVVGVDVPLLEGTLSWAS